MTRYLTRIFFTICLFAASLVANGQKLYNLVSSNTVSTIAYWELGNQKKYRVTSRSEETRETKLIIEEDATFDILFRVAEKSDSFYVIDMTFINYVLPEEPELDTLLQKPTKIYEGIKVRYKVNEFGEFIEILNTLELSKTLSSRIDNLISESSTRMKSEDLVARVFESTMENNRQLFTKEENIEAFYRSYIFTFHGLYGFEFKMNQNVALEREIAAQDGLTLNGTAMVKLNSINKTAKTFSLDVVETPHDEEVVPFILKVSKKRANTTDSQSIESSKLNFDYTTTSHYVFDLATGWIISVNKTLNFDFFHEDERFKKTFSKTFTAL